LGPGSSGGRVADDRRFLCGASTSGFVTVSQPQAESDLPWPIWKLAVAALPVGVAVGAFVAIRWPWNLSAVLALLAIAALLAKTMRRRFSTALVEILVVYAFLFLALLTELGAYAASTVRQAWLPQALLISFGVLAALFGASRVIIGTRKQPG
jgi:hypothetical protein